MDQQQRTRRQLTRRQVLWTAGVVVVAVLAALFVINQLLIHHSLWDWLKLLVVPAVIAGGGLWFNRQQQERQQEDARQQQEREFEIENQRAQDAALQAYLDQIGELLLDKERPLRQSKEGDEVRILARARTKEVLWKLSPHRKRSVLQFLHEASLIQRGKNIIDLSGADLRKAYLYKLDLKDADLRGADLKDAGLTSATLSEADLRGADLRGADLLGADLSDATLSGARIKWLDQIAQLPASRRALEDNERLEVQAESLEGATMPNGQKYEDWLKSRGEGGHDT